MDNIVKLPEPSVAVRHDGPLAISVGGSRFETNWKNRTMSWSALVDRLSRSQRTGETHADYLKLTKEQQDRIKDIGGFVGGHLRNGRRKTGFVECRQVLTLDVDFATKDFTLDLDTAITLGAFPDVAYVIYSTHKYGEGMIRLRLIIPLSRKVSPEEYEPLARKAAEKLGMDLFDDSTYQVTRLMYWPSNSSDVDPVFIFHDGTFLDPDELLAEYPDWTDASYWPESSRMPAQRKREAKKQGDPLEKKGIVGAFCRAYDIPAAIEKFLPEVYTETAKPDRYTYAPGTTAAGLVLYEDGRFAYSNHGTDPACGQLCNAFDLVRIHLFGELDDGVTGKNGKALPSYKAMAELAQDDPAVRVQAVQEAAEAFREAPEAEDWHKRIRINSNGAVTADSWNAELILENDERLKGIRFNEMSRRMTAESVPWERQEREPWRDADDAQLYQWIVREYNVQFPRERFNTALVAVADRRRYHPVKEYLDALPPWDGEPRLDTLFIHYLGAEDNVYVREACRKFFVAAVARVYEPGIKFDCMPVLDGRQGCGKSTFASRFGLYWFSDNLTLSDMRDGKTAAEKLQGFWINELSEMAGMRKIEVEAVKSFISRTEDIYRAAYGRNTEIRLRQSVMIGTTNDSGFLRDITGNRRFWPIMLTGKGEEAPWDITRETVDAVWAEARAAYMAGEKLQLGAEAEKLAEAARRNAMERDERQGIVEAYLERKLPVNWDDLSREARLLFLESDEEGVVERTTVSNVEIWAEAFGNQVKTMEPKDAKAIAAIMARIDGWSRVERSARIPLYGKQKLYERTGTMERWNANLDDF